MSCFDVKILDPNINTIEVETCIGDQPSSIDIVTYNNTNTLEINSCLSFDDIKVKDLLAGSGINISTTSGIYTISLSDSSGPQPSGNYSVVGHTHIISDVSGLQLALDSKQPSGNYSLVGHTHTSSNITDFNSSVSGLLPVKNITAGSGIGISSVSGDFTVSVTGTFALTSEEVDDRVSNLLVAGNYTNLNYNDLANSLTISVTGLQPSGNYSVVGHTHISTDITDSTVVGRSILTAPDYASINNILWEDLVSSSGIFIAKKGGHYVNRRTSFQILVSLEVLDPVNPIAGDYYMVWDQGGNPFQIAGVSYGDGTRQIIIRVYKPAGFLVPPVWETHFLNRHTHSAVQITDFNSSVSGLLPSVTGSGYATSNFTNNVYTIGVTGLQPSGNYSTVGHTHTSSQITDFNSAVSGLLPVKNIVGGSGIGVSSLSGTYTISTTGNFGLTSEEVDDRVASLLVAGTGVSLTYNDPSGTLTIDNLHSEINVLSQEPQGFVNRNDSSISFNDSTRTFSIQPSVSGGSYDIYVEGIKVTKTGIESFVLSSGTALNYIHFNTTPPYSLHAKTTGFDFDTDVPIAFIHWNSDINQSTFFGEERHGIRMDSVTHKWIHNTFGVQYINGLSIGGYTLLGNGSSNSHAQIDISDGILYQEDIVINVTNGVGPGSFIQQLSPIAYIPTYYHSGSTGQWVRDSATNFPLKYNATRAQYNLYSGGTWTAPNVTNNRYFAMWIVATNDMNDPILAIVGQREDSSLTAAENNNNWGDINLTNIPTQELRPLYRLIFVTNDTFTNTPKSSLQSILDIRVAIQSTVAGVVQNDHGSLFGLADDDHSQYVHINNARTIDAIHTFSNGLNASGLISASSGSFTNLTVNNTGVSLVGHSHVSSDITNFASSVSGLLPSVTGSGYVLSSFNNNIYTVSVTGLQPSGNYSVVGHTHTVSDISDFSSSVSGLIGIQNLVGVSGIQIASSGTTRQISTNLLSGNGVAFTYNNDNSLTINTISNNGRILISDNITTNLTIPSGYVPGSLSIYQNGVKLLDSIDYTATNGSGIIFTTSPTSGTYIEYQTPTNTNNIQGLINNTLANNIIAGSGIVLNYDNLNNNLTISVSGNISGGAAAKEVRVDSSAITTIYVGQAPSGTLNSESGWSVVRDIFSNLGILQTTASATGIWDNRTSLIYS